MRLTKLDFNVVIGALGGFMATLFGGFDVLLRSALIFMVVDIIVGVLNSLVFKSSPKTDNGGLESNAMTRGLVKKGYMILMIVIGNTADTALGIDYIRNAVCFGIMANELLSLLETWSMSGLKYPKILDTILEQLLERGEGEDK